MKSRRTLIALLLTTAAVALVAYFQPAWSGWFKQERQVAHSEQASLPQPLEVGEAVAASQDKYRLKKAVVAHLTQGDLTVLEAGAWFLFLNDTYPKLPEHVQEGLPGGSKEEKACRQAVDWAVSRLKERGMEKEVRQLELQLKRELAEQLAKNGRIVLPDLGNTALPALGSD